MMIFYEKRYNGFVCMKDANGGDKPAEPIAQQRVSGETIDVQAKEKSNS